MAKVSINGTEFELYSYFARENGVTIRVKDTTIDEIVAAAGDVSTVEVADEYHGRNLKEERIVREKDVDPETEAEIMTYTVEFNSADLAQTVERNTSDIANVEDAVVELAEIIGGE